MKTGKMQWIHIRNTGTNAAATMRRRLRSHGAKRVVATSSVDTMAQISSKHATGWIDKIVENGNGQTVSKKSSAPSEVVAAPCGAEVTPSILRGHKAGCLQCRKAKTDAQKATAVPVQEAEIPASSLVENTKQKEISDLRVLAQLARDLADRVDIAINALEHSIRLHDEYAALQSQWTESKEKLQDVLR